MHFLWNLWPRCRCSRLHLSNLPRPFFDGSNIAHDHNAPAKLRGFSCHDFVNRALSFHACAVIERRYDSALRGKCIDLKVVILHKCTDAACTDHVSAAAGLLRKCTMAHLPFHHVQFDVVFATCIVERHQLHLCARQDLRNLLWEWLQLDRASAHNHLVSGHQAKLLTGVIDLVRVVACGEDDDLASRHRCSERRQLGLRWCEGAGNRQEYQRSKSNRAEGNHHRARVDVCEPLAYALHHLSDRRSTCALTVDGLHLRQHALRQPVTAFWQNIRAREEFIKQCLNLSVAKRFKLLWTVGHSF